ncbi:MAG TPA: hypothetical protein VF048_00615, partial [Gemmatimonadaceae bacterium]
EARQLASEARERRRELEGLRREVAGQGQDVGDLEQLLDALRTLESRRAYDDPEEVARLQQAVTEGFKAFEFSLRRAIQGDDPARPLLDRSAAAPAEYRQLVEEYYRSLARPRRP